MKNMAHGFRPWLADLEAVERQCVAPRKYMAVYGRKEKMNRDGDGHDKHTRPG